MYLEMKINARRANIPLEYHVTFLMFATVLKSIAGNSQFSLVSESLPEFIKIVHVITPFQISFLNSDVIALLKVSFQIIIVL